MSENHSSKKIHKIRPSEESVSGRRSQRKTGSLGQFGTYFEGLADAQDVVELRADVEEAVPSRNEQGLVCEHHPVPGALVARRVCGV